LGKITRALQKVAEERLHHVETVFKSREYKKFILPNFRESKVDGRLITYFDTKSIISEQYKIITTNILSLNKRRPPRTIAITSSVAGEGKTITSLNLAITMSRAIHNPRIVLIDADMRKGLVNKYLGGPAHQGLSDYLNGNVSWEDIIFSIDIQNLSFIAAGDVPANPAELLASERMHELINALRAHYDFILIDTPPVIPVADSVIVGSQVDGVIMVIQASQTHREILSRSMELLRQANANIIGHVLTNIEYFIPTYIYNYL
jgi:capsular exopolysaccharide synthesis family protein